MEIRINIEEVMGDQARTALMNHLSLLGFTIFEGYLQRQDIDVLNMTVVFKVWPTKRALRFKRFDK